MNKVNFWKLVISLLLLPTILFMGAETVKAFARVAVNFKETLYFLSGIAAYLLVHNLVYNFNRVYVFAHEGAHALAAKMCGYSVSDFNIGEDSGSVKITGSNEFVALAPYLFPVYAIVFSAVYFWVALFADIAAFNKWAFFIIGFLMCFHIVHTYLSLVNATQSDLAQAGGRVFSVSVILVVNIVILLIMFKIVSSSSFSWGGIFKNIFNNTVWFWKTVFATLGQAWRLITK